MEPNDRKDDETKEIVDPAAPPTTDAQTTAQGDGDHPGSDVTDDETAPAEV